MRVFVRFGSGIISYIAWVNIIGWDDTRVARAHRAPNMLASSAFRSIRPEHRTTLMACTSNSLSEWMVDDILAAGARGQGQRCLCFVRYRCRSVRLLGDNGLEGSFRVIPVVARLCRGVLRAALAADVLTVDTDFVGAECGLAAMAGPAHSHTNRSDNTLHSGVVGRSPFSRLKFQSIFGE